MVIVKMVTVAYKTFLCALTPGCRCCSALQTAQNPWLTVHEGAWHGHCCCEIGLVECGKFHAKLKIFRLLYSNLLDFEWNWLPLKEIECYITFEWNCMNLNTIEWRTANFHSILFKFTQSYSNFHSISLSIEWIRIKQLNDWMTAWMNIQYT